MLKPTVGTFITMFLKAYKHMLYPFKSMKPNVLAMFKTEHFMYVLFSKYLIL